MIILPSIFGTWPNMGYLSRVWKHADGADFSGNVKKPTPNTNSIQAPAIMDGMVISH